MTLDAWIRAAGGLFSPEAYLWWTRVQCIAWTTADVALIVALLRLANLCRHRLGRRRHVLSYWVLAATVALAPLVFLVPTGAQIFLVEILITVPHFLIILYLLGASGPGILRILLELESYERQ